MSGYFDLVARIKADTADFERGVSKATTLLDSFKKSIQVASGVLIRDFAQSLIRGGIESLKLGAHVQTLKNSFDAFSAAAGAPVPSLQVLRKATQGMIADVDLLTSANLALALNLPTKDLDKLFDSAVRLGVAMGVDAKQAVEALSYGIGRQNRRVLDNIGIIVKGELAYKKYADSIGVSVQELTVSQRQHAWMGYAIEQVMTKAEKLGDNISAAEKTQKRWNAAIKNAVTSVGSFLSPLSAVTPILESMSPALAIIAVQMLPNFISKLKAAKLSTLGWSGVTETLSTVLMGLPAKIKAVAVALKGFLAAHPYILAVALAIGGVAAAVNYLWSQKSKLLDVEETFKYTMASIESDLQNKLNDITGSVEEAVDKIRNTIVEGFREGLVGEAQAEVEKFTSCVVDKEGDMVDAIDEKLLDLQVLYAENQAEIAKFRRYGQDEEADRLERQNQAIADKMQEGMNLRARIVEQGLMTEEELITKHAEWQKAETARIQEEAERQRSEAEAEAGAEREAAEKERREAVWKAVGTEKLITPIIKMPEIPLEDLRDMLSPEEFEQYLETGAVPGQYGFEGVVRRPTLFLAGEAGPEHVSISPRGGIEGTPVTVNLGGIHVGSLSSELDKADLLRDVKNALIDGLHRAGVVP